MNSIINLHSREIIDKYFVIDWAVAAQILRSDGSISVCNWLREQDYTEQFSALLHEYREETILVSWNTITSESEIGFSVRLICELFVPENLAVIIKLTMV